MIEEKTRACRHLNSAEVSNSTKTKAETNTMWTNYTQQSNPRIQHRTPKKNMIQFTYPEACDWLRSVLQPNNIHLSSMVSAI